VGHLLSNEVIPAVHNKYYAEDIARPQRKTTE